MPTAERALISLIKVYAYNIIMVVVGPERKGREMRVERDDETVGVVGKALAEDVIGGTLDMRSETIEEKTTSARIEAV